MPRDGTAHKKRGAEWEAKTQKMQRARDDESAPSLLEKVAAIAGEALINGEPQRAHRIWHAASVQSGGEDGHLFICFRCGAYTAGAPRLLRSGCPGAPPTKSREEQRRRFMLSLHPCPSARYKEIVLTGARPCMRELMQAASEAEHCQRPPRHTGLTAWQPYAASITDSLASVGLSADSAWQLGAAQARADPADPANRARRRICAKTRVSDVQLSDSDHEGIETDIEM